MMNELINFLMHYIEWLKEYASIIFAVTATIISILTYRRAKATILQPLRSETIKKQSILFSELIGFLSAKNHDIHDRLDYINIIRISIFKLLEDLGFRSDEFDKFEDKFRNECASWIWVGKSNIMRDVKLVETFENTTDVDCKDFVKIRFSEFEKGNYDIERIFLTKKHHQFIEKMAEFADNPFIPKKISDIFVELFADIQLNLTIHMKRELAEFLNEFRVHYIANGKIEALNIDGIYNKFNRSCMNHRTYWERINSEIRKLLLIDSNW
ncbi:MAG: hypothetical protein RAO94_05630 [Candidatus Stygibacter australis]|nr:hypothetical protein [Candidatus Stygibacter australis]MDP8321810.1 hypothetical protein [Candidatus Stygibacter australis]